MIQYIKFLVNDLHPMILLDEYSGSLSFVFICINVEIPRILVHLP